VGTLHSLLGLALALAWLVELPRLKSSRQGKLPHLSPLCGDSFAIRSQMAQKWLLFIILVAHLHHHHHPLLFQHFLVAIVVAVATRCAPLCSAVLCCKNASVEWLLLKYLSITLQAS